MNTKLFKARDWQRTCLACGKTFHYADGFDCPAQPGRHTVDPVEYFHLGAAHVQSIRERRKWTPMLNLVGEKEVRDKVTGEIARVDGLMVQFHEGGRYETSDPLEQYHLDMHPAVLTGPAGLAAWEKVYLTQDQQLAKAQSTLADLQKQIRDSNALLDLTKQKKGERDGVAVR